MVNYRGKTVEATHIYARHVPFLQITEFLVARLRMRAATVSLPLRHDAVNFILHSWCYSDKGTTTQHGVVQMVENR